MPFVTMGLFVEDVEQDQPAVYTCSRILLSTLHCPVINFFGRIRVDKVDNFGLKSNLRNSVLLAVSAIQHLVLDQIPAGVTKQVGMLFGQKAKTK